MLDLLKLYFSEPSTYDHVFDPREARETSKVPRALANHPRFSKVHFHDVGINRAGR